MAHLIHQSNNITIQGPVIEIVVLPSKPVMDANRKQGKPSPSVKLVALIDTGASTTCIDKSIASQLSLIPRDIKKVQTAGGEDEQNLYDVSIVLPLAQQTALNIQVLEAKLEKQPYRALIGRDILSHCTFVYNGWNNSYTIHL